MLSNQVFQNNSGCKGNAKQKKFSHTSQAQIYSETNLISKLLFCFPVFQFYLNVFVPKCYNRWQLELQNLRFLTECEMSDRTTTLPPNLAIFSSLFFVDVLIG